MAGSARISAPPPRTAAAVAAGVLALAAVASRSSPTGAALLVVLLAFVASFAYVIWRAEPIVTFTAAFLLSPISGNWEGLGIPGVLSPNRIVLALAIVAVLLRSPPSVGRPTLRPRPVHWLMLAAATYAVLSAALAGTLLDRASLASLLERFGLLPFLAFFAAPAVFRTRRDRDVLLAVLVVLGAYLGLTALFETVGFDRLVFPSYINDPNFGILPDRARGPFVEPVINAFALFACGGACVMALGAWRSGLARLFAGGTALLCAMGVLFTLTRSAWIGAVAATIVTLLASPPLRRRALPVLVVLPLILAVAALSVPGFSAKATERGATRSTVYDRLVLNRAAVNMLEARPLVGFGWGTYFRYNRDYLEQGDDYPLPERISRFPVHNLYLGLGAELGLLGTGLWLAAMVAAVGGALIRRSSPDLLPWRFLLLAVAIFYLSISSFAPTTTFSTLLLLFLTGVVNGGSPQWAFEPSPQPVARA